MKKSGVVIISILVILALIGSAGVRLLPNTPQNAVRLAILKNGHPVIALTETPKRLNENQREDYSGKSAWRYYQVKTVFDANNGWININTLAVNQPEKGSSAYRVHLVYSVA
ncbi:hypothetical protein [Levilactobacillus mulengensis]|uniref:hypothetical protein n=1 Tax=Levilactobacillus mulengensis TaxID=2486025 RepID=UPI000F7B53E3|nr:hypothetical protein [Levilactobacillus mulengensis]